MFNSDTFVAACEAAVASGSTYDGTFDVAERKVAVLEAAMVFSQFMDVEDDYIATEAGKKQDANASDATPAPAPAEGGLKTTLQNGWKTVKEFIRVVFEAIKKFLTGMSTTYVYADAIKLCENEIDARVNELISEVSENLAGLKNAEDGVKKVSTWWNSRSAGKDARRTASPNRKNGYKIININTEMVKKAAAKAEATNGATVKAKNTKVNAALIKIGNSIKEVNASLPLIEKKRGTEARYIQAVNILVKALNKANKEVVDYINLCKASGDDFQAVGAGKTK